MKLWTISLFSELKKYQRWYWWVVGIGLLVLTSDQVSKYYVDCYLPIREIQVIDEHGRIKTFQVYVGSKERGEWDSPIPIVPGFFYLVHVVNRGAAWGIMSGFTYQLAIISLLGFFLILLWAPKICNHFIERWIGVGVLIGGTVGNLVDRLDLIPRKSEIHGVVDFISLQYRRWGLEWPAFNIADMGITIGVALIMISLYSRKTQPSSSSEVTVKTSS